MDAAVKKIRNKAVMLATLTGYGGVFLIDCLQFAVPDLINNSGNSNADLLAGLIIAYLIIGLPIAFAICFPIGTLIWNRLYVREKLNAANCVGGGLALGAILWLGLGFMIAKELSPIFLLADVVSTIAIGGLAGWIGFLASKKALPSKLNVVTFD